MLITLLFLAGLILFTLGMFFGEHVERTDWCLTGGTSSKDRTPHHARGKFYYIIPEHEYVVCKEPANGVQLENALMSRNMTFASGASDALGLMEDWACDRAKEGGSINLQAFLGVVGRLRETYAWTLTD